MMTEKKSHIPQPRTSSFYADSNSSFGTTYGLNGQFILEIIECFTTKALIVIGIIVNVIYYIYLGTPLSIKK